MKKIIITILILFVPILGFSQEKKNKNANHSIEVKGNCEQCQKRIQKATFRVKGVKSAFWDMETHQLKLIINEQKTSVLSIKKAIAAVGHDTDEAKATDEVYDDLHECCKYDRN